MKFLSNRTTHFLLSVLSLVIVVVSFILPSFRHESVIKWPTDQSDITSDVIGTDLLVARHRAATIKVQLPCSADSLPVGGTLFETSTNPAVVRSLLLKLEGTDLLIISGQNTVRIPEWVNVDSCLSMFHLEGKSWRLERDGVVVGEDTFDDYPLVTHLIAQSRLVGTEPGMFSVELKTLTTGSSAKPVQLILQTIGAVLAGLAGLGIIWGGRFGGERGPRKRPFRKYFLNPIDLLVVTVVSGWVILGPILLDDGWIVQSVDAFLNSGEFRAYHNGWDSWIPVGLPYYGLLVPFVAVSKWVLWLRIPALLMTIGGWLLFRKIASSLELKSPKSIQILGALFYAAWSCAWAITLRPEPLVALLSMASLLLVIKFVRTLEVHLLLGMGLLLSIAVNVHTTGVILLAPILYALPRTVSMLRCRGKEFLPSMAASILLSVNLFLLSLFFGSDISVWRENQSAWSSIGLANLGWREERARYVHLFGPSMMGTPLRRVVVLMMVLTFVMAFTRVRKKNDSRNIPSMVALLSVVLLSFTPSKWPWHFGSIGGIVAVSFFIEVFFLFKESERGLLTRSLLSITGSMLCLTVAAGSVAEWGLYNTFGETPAWASEIFSALLNGWVIISLTLAIFGLAKLFSSRGVSTFSAFIGVGLLLVLAVEGGRLADNGFRQDGWTLQKYSIWPLTDAESCGLGDAMKFSDPLDAKVLPRFQGEPIVGREFESLELAGPRFASSNDSGGAELTGERFETRVTSDSDTGWVAGRWQDAPDGNSGLYVNIVGQTAPNGPVRLALELYDGSSQTALQDLDLTSNSSQWRRFRLPEVPLDVIALRLVAFDDDETSEGWVGFSALMSAETHTVSYHANTLKKSFLIEPFIRLHFPCVSEPPMANGIAEVPDVVIGGIPLTWSSAPSLVQQVYPIYDVQGSVKGHAVQAIKIVDHGAHDFVEVTPEVISL